MPSALRFPSSFLSSVRWEQRAPVGLQPSCSALQEGSPAITGAVVAGGRRGEIDGGARPRSQPHQAVVILRRALDGAAPPPHERRALPPLPAQPLVEAV